MIQTGRPAEQELTESEAGCRVGDKVNSHFEKRMEEGVRSFGVSEFRMAMLEAETFMFVDHAAELFAYGFSLGLEF
jgi:hypothetical protein